MPEEPLESLFVSAVLSVPLAALTVAILKGRIPFLRFRGLRELREPPLWGWAEIVLVLSLWLLLQHVLMPPFYFLSGERPAVAFAWTQLVVACAIAWVADVWIFRRLGQRWSTLGLSRTSLRDLIASVVVGALSLIPLGLVHGAWLLLLRGLLGDEPPPQDLVRIFAGLVEKSDWVSVGHLIAAGIVVAPLVEETLFRGFLYGALRLRWGSGLAAVSSSFLFALAHFSLGAFPALFIFGCLLCALYEKSGSLLGPMTFHSLFNGLQFATLLYAGS